MPYLQIFIYSGSGAVIGAALMFFLLLAIEKIRFRDVDVLAIETFNKKIDKAIKRLRKKDIDGDKLGIIIQSAAGRNFCRLPAQKELYDLKYEKSICEMESLENEMTICRLRGENEKLSKENDGLRQALDDIQTRDKVTEPRKNPPKKPTKGARK